MKNLTTVNFGDPLKSGSRRCSLLSFVLDPAFDADVCSSNDASRRSSRATSIESRRRRSSVISPLLRHGAAGVLGHRRSADVISGKSSRSSRRPGPSVALPGIEISRIDTMDFDDASVYSSGTSALRLGGAVGVGTGSRGRHRFIIVHSDGSSDISHLSFPSEYSLSATSRRLQQQIERSNSPNLLPLLIVTPGIRMTTFFCALFHFLITNSNRSVFCYTSSTSTWMHCDLWEPAIKL